MNKQETSLIVALFHTATKDQPLPNLNDFAVQNKLSLDSITTLRTTLEKDLNDQVFMLSHLIFHRATLSQNWGMVGQQQMRISLTRLLLKLPANQGIAYDDEAKFQALLTDNLNLLGLADKTEAELNTLFENFKFKFLGIEADIDDVTKINRFLRWLGSKELIQGGYYGYEKEVIFGRGPSFHRGDYEVYIIESEHCRTPNTVTSMAAVIGENQIFIRDEALETLFYEKWVPAIESGHWVLDMVAHMPERALSEKIKQQVFKGYGVDGKDALINTQPQFIKDLKETVLCHELGHGIVQYHTLPLIAATCAESTKLFDENIVISLLEILADMAPSFDDAQGPFINMANIAKDHPERAHRMFHMYLSDVWFYDTDDEYMLTYADLILMVMLKHYEQGVVDFEGFRQELTVQEGYVDKTDQLTLLEWVLKKVISLTQRLQGFAHSAQYTIDGETLGFDELHEKIMAEIETKEGVKDEYATQTGYWTEMFDALIKQSDQYERVKGFLNEQEGVVVQEFFEFCFGDQGLSPREFLFDKLKGV